MHPWLRLRWSALLVAALYGVAALVPVAPRVASGADLPLFSAGGGGRGPLYSAVGPLERPPGDDLRDRAEVAGTDGDGLRLRAAADPDAETRLVLPDGARVDVLDGPVVAAERVWYRVRYEPEAATGWVAAEYLRAVDVGAPREAPPVLARAAADATDVPRIGPLARVESVRAPPGAPDWRAHLVAPAPAALQPVRALPPVDSADGRFGLVEAFRLGDLARALGARHERLTFWWRGLQAAPSGNLNPFYLPADVLERERRNGFTLVGLLINTPDWAAANPQDGARSVPMNLHLPWDHPHNYWGRFVEQMAREYAGRVDDWIVWNEPDIQPGDPNASYYTWAGSIEEYYQLLRVAYRAAKRGNPAAKVHLAGLTYWVDRHEQRPQYFERLLDVMAADPTAAEHNYYFDVATLHLYTDPRALYSVTNLYRDLMRAKGMDKPIWINETNVIPWDDPTNQGTGYDLATGMRCTLADQASYLLQAFGLGLAGGAERIAVYRSEDGYGAAYNGAVDAIERSALVREDGSLRPAFAAYQTAVSHLREARAATYFPSATAEAVVVERPGGQRTTVLWNAAPYPVVGRLPAAGARAELVNAVGQAQALEPAPDGEYAIALAPATCNTDLDDPSRYLMGGATYLVVESNVPADAPARPARMEPLPPPVLRAENAR